MLGRARAKGVIIDRAYRGHDLVATLASLRDDLPDLRTLFYFDEWRAHLEQTDGPPPPSPPGPTMLR